MDVMKVFQSGTLLRALRVQLKIGYSAHRGGTTVLRPIRSLPGDPEEESPIPTGPEKEGKAA
jgi:hypothetical protein